MRTNWLQAPIDEPWYANALGDVLEGYKKGREPYKMAQEEERQRLLAEQLGLGNFEQRFKNEHLPEVHEMEMRKGNADIERIMEQTGLTRQQIEELKHSLSLDKQFGSQERALGIESKRLGNQKARAEMALEQQTQEMLNNIFSSQNNPNLEDKASLIQRALFKKRFGIDPYAPAPLTEGEKIFQRETSKENQKFVSENTEALLAAEESLSDINQVKELIESPFASASTGPLGAYTPNIRKGSREFSGEFQRIAGRLKSNIARLEKGATSDKERAMIDKAEISLDDTLPTIKGKLIAQSKYLQKLIKRRELILDFLKNGYNRDEAVRMSMKEISLNKEDPIETKQISGKTYYKYSDGWHDERKS